MDNLDKLPRRCLSTLPSDPSLVICIQRGEEGYYPQPHIKAEQVEPINSAWGVSKAQREAMVVGSMFGWDVPGADPAKYAGVFGRD